MLSRLKSQFPEIKYPCIKGFKELVSSYKTSDGKEIHFHQPHIDSCTKCEAFGQKEKAGVLTEEDKKAHQAHVMDAMSFIDLGVETRKLVEAEEAGSLENEFTFVSTDYSGGQRFPSHNKEADQTNADFHLAGLLVHRVSIVIKSPHNKHNQCYGLAWYQMDGTAVRSL